MPEGRAAPPFVSRRARGCHAKAGFFRELQTRTGDACGWRKISVGPECETGPGAAGTGKPAVGWRRIPPCFQSRTRTARCASSGRTDCRSILGSARSCGCGRGDLTAAVGYAVSRRDRGCVSVRTADTFGYAGYDGTLAASGCRGEVAGVFALSRQMTADQAEGCRWMSLPTHFLI